MNNPIRSIKKLARNAAASVALVALAAGTAGKAQAFGGPSLGDALQANGFATLALALEITELTSVLDSNLVTVFAPTDDVFAATAEALGCTDAVDLATRLINFQVGETDALTAILTYHATLEVIRNPNKLLRQGDVLTVNGGTIETGVNAKGLYVLGDANTSASAITSTAVGGVFWKIYPIDQILLPFAPPAGLCDPV